MKLVPLLFQILGSADDWYPLLEEDDYFVMVEEGPMLFNLSSYINVLLYILHISPALKNGSFH